MKIFYNQIEEETLNIDHSFRFVEGEETFDVTKFIGTVERAGDAYVLDGNIACTYSCPCDRCLEEFSEEYKVRVTLTLSPLDEYPVAGTDEEVGLSDEEAGMFVTAHDSFDLEDVLHDEVLLLAPVKRLCAEDCKGLCADCGADLNKDKCTCTGNAASPFAMLAQLKKDK